MINNSVYENKTAELYKKAFDEAMQIIIYYHKGEPDNYVKGRLLYIKGIFAEIRKVQGEVPTTEAGKCGIG